MIEQKNKIIFAIEQISQQMTTLARAIHAQPELSFEEHHASAALQAPSRPRALLLPTVLPGLRRHSAHV